jgi:MFS family permease
MNWKMLVAVVALAPFVALLGGLGVAAYNVSQTWDSRNTDALISGLVASCGMGGIVIAGLLAAVIGIPFAMRLMDRWREADRYALPTARRWPLPAWWQGPPAWAEQPPMLTDKQQPGQWISGGQYDVWEDQPEDRGSANGWR